jgi:hypothetical protein
LESTRTSIPVDIALAVVLASQGLDSREAMATEAARLSALHAEEYDDDSYGLAGGWAQAEAMIRRGTVDA